MHVLCLDIEGGFGGSSRSLYESIQLLPDQIDAEVWCRKAGPIQSRYEALGVPCRVMPDMPHVSSLPRLSRNLYVYGRFALGWGKTRGFRESLARAARDKFDLVHFNHEGLFLIARWLRSDLGAMVRLTTHVRTHLPSTLFSRWQYRTLVGVSDQLVFITEMERDNITRLTGRKPEGSVIYNIVSPPDAPIAARALASEERFKIASVSNYSWIRGNDRLVDIAVAIKALGRRDVLFVVAGRIDLHGSLPGVLGRIARRGGTLADYAKERGVDEMFRFLGHLPDPVSTLAGCNMLARPSRGNDPWGREVLEAMAVGLPVLATGTYDRFVENGVTGILQSEFDAAAMAETIVKLMDNQAMCNRLGERARARVTELCDGPKRAEELAALWLGLAA